MPARRGAAWATCCGPTTRSAKEVTVADPVDDLDLALADLADRAPHDPRLAETVRIRARRRRTASLSAAAAVAVVVLGSVMAWQRGAGDTGVTGAACAGAVAERELPEWATTGFTDPHPVMPYAVSRSGDIVAILFGRLSAPPDAQLNNKVLWVSRASSGIPVVIHARLEGTDVTADTVLPGGLGPSTVNMPRPGCWRMELSWPSGQDEIVLPYQPPLRPASGTP
jgi:hypothetical protein